MVPGDVRQSSSRGIDARWLLAAVIVAVYALLFAAPGRPALLTVWNAYGVDHRAPAFLDLRVVTTAPDAVRDGLDPIAENPRDPLRRAMNHPRVWTLLRHVGLSERHTVPLGFCLAAAFAAAVLAMAGRLTLAEAAIYSALACSPAALMAVERGNVDVLLFCLLVAATMLVTKRRTHLWAYAVVFACAVLKLFPVFAFTLAFRERLRTGVAVLASAAVAFGAYLFVTRHDVAAVLANSIQGIYLSYGRKILLERLRDFGLPIDANVWSAVLVALVVAAAVGLATRTRAPEFTPGTMEKMLIGAGIYCGSFVLLSNFNYRMIFVLLAVPQLLVWRKSGGAAKRCSTAAIVTMVIAFGLSGQLRSWFFVLKECANWLMFTGAVWLLWNAAMAWLRDRPAAQVASNSRSAAVSLTGA
jgi:hypothetical protein